jgi:hypothetical protein
MNVLTRLLYNEYGRGFGRGWDKRQLMRIMNNPGDCGNALNRGTSNRTSNSVNKLSIFV